MSESIPICMVVTTWFSGCFSFWLKARFLRSPSTKGSLKGLVSENPPRGGSAGGPCGDLVLNNNNGNNINNGSSSNKFSNINGIA